MTEPLVKWAGGKRRLAGSIASLVEGRLTSGGRYVEPFLGGAAVALSLPLATPVMAGDACEPLIRCYSAVAARPDDVHKALTTLIAEHTEARYYVVRADVPDDCIYDAARFIYLNKAGFNGLYRVNRSGIFNVPCGRRRGDTDRPPGCPTIGALRLFARRARRWRMSSGDFESLVDSARIGDVVYADPPYDGTFTYSQPFGDDEHGRLAEALRRANARGAAIISTNADTPLIRRLYAWAEIISTAEAWSVAASASSRGDAQCVLITT